MNVDTFVVEPTRFGNKDGLLVMEPFEGALDSDYETYSLNNVKLNSNEEINECNQPKYPKYNPIEMNIKHPLRLGLEFNSIKEFKVAMKEWCLLNERDMKRRPNDSKRCKV